MQAGGFAGAQHSNQRHSYLLGSSLRQALRLAGVLHQQSMPSRYMTDETRELFQNRALAALQQPFNKDHPERLSPIIQNHQNTITPFHHVAPRGTGGDGMIHK